MKLDGSDKDVGPNGLSRLSPLLRRPFPPLAFRRWQSFRAFLSLQPIGTTGRIRCRRARRRRGSSRPSAGYSRPAFPHPTAALERVFAFQMTPCTLTGKRDQSVCVGETNQDKCLVTTRYSEISENRW